jgi:hypothetical protein
VNARTLVAALAAVALAPGAAAARPVPLHHPSHPARPAVKHAVVPRVLCICVTGAPTQPAASEAELEAELDQDLIAHGLDPIYGTTTVVATTSASATTAG